MCYETRLRSAAEYLMQRIDYGAEWLDALADTAVKFNVSQVNLAHAYDHLRNLTSKQNVTPRI